MLFLLFLTSVEALHNGLSRTPAMGWNNWNSLYCDVSESLLLDTSQILIDSGLRDVGYQYVVLDDCWSDGRDEAGRWRADADKFPHGMKYISDSLHARGLLYGMYSSAGELTCGRYAGSLDHEKEDAQSLADWGVDYFKYDNCYNLGRMGTAKLSFDRYNTMAQALLDTGREIVYSICNWGEDYVHSWGMSIANSWRISGDIYDSFARPDPICSCTDERDPHCIAPGSACSVLFILNRVAAYSDRGRPGAWNDLDMLEVGQGGMTDEEYKAHFSMWAMVKSPLLLGHDLRTMTAKTLSIINNPAIIALNQDPLGSPAIRIARNESVPKDGFGVGETHVWSGTLANGDQVVALLNAADADLPISISLEEIFVRAGPGGRAAQTKQEWLVYDLWANRMSETHAHAILDAADDAAREAVFRSVNWYNATELPYVQGLKAGDTRLLGEKIGSVLAGGKLEALVARHSAKIFRLRPASGEVVKPYILGKDEL
ncbi:hypothetical protein ASPZODRAFT_74133 [Penicilliopsis zonata CBS 506.65]|uniref:Alpha-galactosidase n=1 Tax=Penicilliopsis zonata CBS 506.65 TaxID=1073090 RepID=A0A1L9S8V3_9EURO|nr:hypothetical protein ASPZODRAFT_74133 [Penicilliopsis zonata CBS 506.65]OJJ43549.1 hypothetical protein ASPZODRAFT_74133 [Penicilliopsis zonata CBS 506.65]